MLQKCLEVTLIPLVRILLHVFFRQIEIAGTERIPADKPLIYTPNHLNSLVDGLLARVFLPGDPRPLAKATLWDITLIRPLLVAGAATPRPASYPEGQGPMVLDQRRRPQSR